MNSLSQIFSPIAVSRAPIVCMRYAYVFLLFLDCLIQVFRIEVAWRKSNSFFFLHGKMCPSIFTNDKSHT